MRHPGARAGGYVLAQSGSALEEDGGLAEMRAAARPVTRATLIRAIGRGAWWRLRVSERHPPDLRPDQDAETEYTRGFLQGRPCYAVRWRGGEAVFARPTP